MVAEQRSPSDWWAERSDRERQGLLVSAGGVLAAVIGVVLLPWLEASSPRSGTARVSFFDVMKSLGDIKDDLSTVEAVVLGTGWFLPVGAGVLALAAAWDAFQPTSSTSPVDGAGFVLLAGAYFGWIVYAVNRDLEAGSQVMFALSIDARIGPGAWVTLVGLAVVAGGVMYGAQNSSGAP